MVHVRIIYAAYAYDGSATCICLQVYTVTSFSVVLHHKDYGVREEN